MTWMRKLAGRRRKRHSTSWLPGTVAELEAEREAVQPLLALAQEVEDSRSERKLTELLDVVASLGLKEDRRKQLLIFTEHKDTLDYLVENLSRDFEVAQIHGQMKLTEPDRAGALLPRDRSDHGGDRGSWRGHQPPVLPSDGQLRHPLEPQPAGAADGPHPPDRPDRRRVHLQPRRHATPARATSSTCC